LGVFDFRIKRNALRFDSLIFAYKERENSPFGCAD